MNMTETPGGSVRVSGGRNQAEKVRGGRLTKYHGQAASFAPGLVFGQSAASLISSVSSSALALALMIAAPLSLTVTGARATDCVVGAPGVFVCSDASVHNEYLLSAVGGSLVVTTAPGFSVDTTGSGDDAITLRNLAGDFNITFTDENSSAITGDDDGIEALNRGAGFLSITTTGVVTGTTGVGIVARNYNVIIGTDLTINAQGAVQGGDLGVFARNDGTGLLSITTQAVTGTSNAGIVARNNNADSTDLTINAQGAVQGGVNGVFARNNGTGALSITTQEVTGTSSTGIIARNYNADSTDLTINAQGAVQGGVYGVSARNDGTGAVSITTQAVTGTNNIGIYALNYNPVSTDLTINAQGAVQGGTYGVYARNNSTGAVSITTQAVTGTSNAGIIALKYNADSTDLTINAQGAVQGGTFGVYARNNGTGLLSITSNAAVTGGTEYGISTRTGAGGTTVITLNAGATVSATSGQAIFNDAGDSTTIVDTGASVAGTISLNDGSDDLAFAGGDFSGVTLFDGGDDIGTGDGFIDVLTFAGSSGALIGANVINWENVTIGTGSTISFSDGMLLAGLLETTGGGILDASGGALVLDANVLNNGTITMLDGAVGDTLTVNGDFSGLGSFLIDVDLASDMADTLVINGDVTGGSTTVSVFDIAAGPATGNDVQIVNVTGTTNAGDFTLATPGIGAFLYDLALIGGNDWVLQQLAGFNPATAVYEAYPQILLGLNSLPTLRQRAGDQYAAYSGKGVVETGGQPTPIWTRIEGDRSVVAPALSTTALNYALRQYRVQAGLDGQVMDGSGGRLMAGVNASYGMGTADIFSATGNGSIATDLASLGATATWFGNGGFYLDGQAQMSWYTSDLSNVASGLLAGGNQGVGYAISLEAGQSVDLGGGTSITPQAQLVYSSVGFDDFVGPGGAAVSLEAADSLLARLGLSIDQSQSWTASDGVTSSSQIYGLANLYYELAGPSQVDVSGTDFINQPEQASAEIGLGGSFSWDDEKITLFGEITAATSLENAGDSYRYQGTAGARISF